MSSTPVRIFLTPEFSAWRDTLEPKQERRLEGRLGRLRQGHFGDSRSLDEGLFELKWRSGLRVYYSRTRAGNVDIIVLHGGFKGTQHADIQRARRLQACYEETLRGGGAHA